MTDRKQPPPMRTIIGVPGQPPPGPDPAASAAGKSRPDKTILGMPRDMQSAVQALRARDREAQLREDAVVRGRTQPISDVAARGDLPAGARFDPHTGQPLPPVAAFDPQTGRPLYPPATPSHRPPEPPRAQATPAVPRPVAYPSANQLPLQMRESPAPPPRSGAFERSHGVQAIGPRAPQAAGVLDADVPTERGTPRMAAGDSGARQPLLPAAPASPSPLEGQRTVLHGPDFYKRGPGGHASGSLPTQAGPAAGPELSARASDQEHWAADLGSPQRPTEPMSDSRRAPLAAADGREQEGSPRLSLERPNTQAAAAAPRQLRPGFLVAIALLVLLGGAAYAFRRPLILTLRGGAAAETEAGAAAASAEPLPEAPSGLRPSAAEEAAAGATRPPSAAAEPGIPPTAAAATEAAAGAAAASAPSAAAPDGLAELEKQAIELLMANDYAAARDAYDRLRGAAPNRPEYAVMVNLLARELSCKGNGPCLK